MARAMDTGGTRGRPGRAGAASPSASGKAPKSKKPRFAWVRQIRQAYTMAKRSDPRLGLIVAGVGLGILLAFVLIGLLIDYPIYLGFIGLMVALPVMMIVFGRRAERAAFAQVEGQLGAAAGVLQSLRRGWTVTPAVAVTRNQDVVHRAVGRPGVVLVGEGVPTRVETLLAQEKRKLTRLLPDVPVHTIQAGTGEGQVPLRRLQRTVVKLPRTLRPAQVTEVDRRLTALGGLTVPLPKGPMPRNARMPKMPKAPRG